MPAKDLNRKNEEGIFSHIYNKGVEQKVIFNDPEDYQVFLGFIKEYLTAPQDADSIKREFTVRGRLFRGTPHQPKNYFNKVELIAYSLKPNHFHLVLQQKVVGSLESFIRSLSTRYSIYFNKKYSRSGALFAGPYKSVEIKTPASLLQLSCFLHSDGEYSSYPEYLGQRQTSWVKPEVVLQFLNQGTAGYQQFVQHYKPDQSQQELLKGIAFEAMADHLERITPVAQPQIEVVENPPVQPYTPQPPAEIAPTPLPVETPQQAILQRNLKAHQRIPEFLAAVVVFSLLTAIGVTNIKASPINNSNQFVLGIATTAISTAATIKPAPSPTVTPTATPVILKTEEAATPPPVEIEKAKNMLTIKTTTGPTKVNIHQQPDAKSKTVAKGKSGQAFEIVSLNGGWYEVKLDDGTTGFISKEYIKIGETNNK